MANRSSREEKEEKGVQDRVHNQVGHREGKIEIEMELGGYEVFDKVKCVSQVRMAKGREAQDLVER